MPESQNIVGEQVRRLRSERGLTQEQLAARCQVLGLELSRGTLSKIESGLRCVVDFELPFLAKALDTPLLSLFPEKWATSRKAAQSARGRIRMR